MKVSIIVIKGYEGLFEKIPSTQEIRGTIRGTANRSLIGNKIVVEGRMNFVFGNTRPTKIGRTASSKQSSRFGHIPIGNSIGSRGKRFTG